VLFFFFFFLIEREKKLEGMIFFILDLDGKNNGRSLSVCFLSLAGRLRKFIRIVLTLKHIVRLNELFST
jgi:hypothetical protein